MSDSTAAPVTVADRVAHFTARLAFETDPSDVQADLEAGVPFVLVDVRGEAAWNQGHASAAVHLPHQEILQRAPAEVPIGTRVVVYCWGPGCNGAHKGALAFATLGYDVREMIGGFEYWAREGLPVEAAHGDATRTPDPLTAPVTLDGHGAHCDC